MKDAVSDTVATLYRLPRVLERAETALEKFDNGELPNIENAQRAGAAGRFAGIHAALGLIAALLVTLLILELI